MMRLSITKMMMMMLSGGVEVGRRPVRWPRSRPCWQFRGCSAQPEEGRGGPGWRGKYIWQLRQIYFGNLDKYILTNTC